MPQPPDDDREKKLSVAKDLLGAFKMERIAYLISTLVSVIFLLVVAVILMSRESYVMAIGMFGASGVIAYSIGRLLTMWNQLVKIIFGPMLETK